MMVLENKTNPLLERILERLQALNMTEREASMRAFGHGSAISNIRNGKSRNPSIGTIQKLAEVLEVNSDWLLSNSATEPNEQAESMSAEELFKLATERVQTFLVQNNLSVSRETKNRMIAGAAKDILDEAREPTETGTH